jgi:DNA-binding NarL/FixJ family response regulator
MTPLSRWKLQPEAEKQVKEILVQELTKIGKIPEMEMLADLLWSETEKLILAKRVLAFILIKKGMSDTEIAKRLHLTRETVQRQRIRYIRLLEKDKPVSEVIDKIETSRVVKEIMQGLMKYAVTAAFGKIPR